MKLLEVSHAHDYVPAIVCCTGFTTVFAFVDLWKVALPPGLNFPLFLGKLAGARRLFVVLHTDTAFLAMNKFEGKMIVRIHILLFFRNDISQIFLLILEIVDDGLDHILNALRCASLVVVDEAVDQRKSNLEQCLLVPDPDH